MLVAWSDASYTVSVSSVLDPLRLWCLTFLCLLTYMCVVVVVPAEPAVSATTAEPAEPAGCCAA